MISLFLKEVAQFFSSLTGYIVVVVFMVVNGLFLWVFPGNMNILEAGRATLDSLFFIAPWVFLFLIPAITMRSFSEEKKSGKLELLLTRPLTEMQIVLAKYGAAVLVAIIALLPTLFFFISVLSLQESRMPMDTGATWGSYIGLVMIAAIYASIGIFASSLTDNSIIAFVISVLMCFLLFSGFDMISLMDLGSKPGIFIMKLGIKEHYQSISRGVIDTRDLVYFLSVIVLFLGLTRYKLKTTY
ncbi:MAG: gliding motility-associated ABC transporter permease subunit GldF [Bacteroidales bacterium]|nr:gliding motility-associated ABC transporter permease subunit GldF [Bacteroidales bacterium]